VRLKRTYGSREVAALTGLSARQLQWWDACRLVSPTVASHRTAAGGFTERRYSPLELIELLALADLRRHGFSVHAIRTLLDTLRRDFGLRLFDAIGEGGSLTLLTDGRDVYGRDGTGRLFSMLREPGQPLLLVGGEEALRELDARARTKRKKKKPASRSERSRRGRPPAEG
jgi:DNA-binding transcriptional MerR regulator